ncbi:MAG: hypothetical protein HRT57_02160 [Crocinitomicaceae bacterium]|nr:hypothetical protein [Crocinitomicaceae bacterium]
MVITPSFDLTNNHTDLKYSILTTTLIGLVSITITANSQNLVPNGSFEDYTALPNSTSDWKLYVGWNNVNMSLGN